MEVLYLWLNSKLCVIVIILFLAFTFSGCGSSKETVAVVNGEEIYKSKYEKNFEQVKTVFENQGASIEEEMEEQIRQQLINELIIQEILIQEADKRRVEISDQKVEKEISEIKSTYEDEEDFLQELEYYGLTEDEFKDNISMHLLFNELMEEMLDEEDIKVKEKEIVDRYEEEKERFRYQQEMLEGQISEDSLEKIEEGEITELENRGEFEDFEELKPDLTELIRKQKMQEKFSEIVEELKEKSEIEVLI